MQATGASTHASSAVLAEELHEFWQHLMRDSGAEIVRILDELDLSMTQMKVLYVLAGCERENALSVKELAERLGISLPGASRTADGLLRRDLVERREDPDDRRIKRLTITDTGRQTLVRLNAARLAGIERYAERLTPEQRTALYAALQTLPHRSEKDAAA